MNNSKRADNSLVAKSLGLLMFGIVCSPAQASNAAPSLNHIECLFNWAQTFYIDLFSPPTSGLLFSSPYTYRYYPNTDAYVGLSSDDNHVYYLGPDGIFQDQGDLSVWLTQSGCGERRYPVIFIHGLGSSADTWIPYRDYLINNGLWVFGGTPVYSQTTKAVSIDCPLDLNVKCTGNAGDFYALNFSENQRLSFDTQGGELAAVINAVLEANPDKKKVLLVGHSMGGLAAREYLQGLARESSVATTIAYRGDVAKLITIGTPHQGSFWAEECRNDISFCDLLPVEIDPDSIALDELQPGSPALNRLNDLTAHPLPPDISYVSIIGTGQATLDNYIDFKDGDGIVTDISQDLAMVAGDLPQQSSVRIEIPFRDACGNRLDLPFIGTIGETHSCESTDTNVGAEILTNLH